MKRTSGCVIGGLVIGLTLTAGCDVFQVPIEVSLDEATALFEVISGTPAQKTFSSPIDTGGVTLGSGSLRIDPAALSVTESGAKLAQTGVVCGDACSTAQVDATTCDQVCNLGEINATIWIGTADEIATVCQTGDEYGPYRVTLDGTMQPIGVTPASVAFQSKTLQAFNAGQASFCVEVVSPVTGTIRLSSLALTAGL